jgi:hypothetical protein
MPRTTRPPSLPPHLIDGLLDGLQRVSAVADLLCIVGTGIDPSLLRSRTVAGAADIIGNETDRMLELICAHQTVANLAPPKP